MMFKQILFTLLAVTMISCAPLGLTKDCDPLSCAVLTSEEQIQQSSRSSQEIHSDETAIYYEPAELDPDEPRVYSNHPFYIVNPARKLVFKTGRKSNKRRTKSTQEENDADTNIPSGPAPNQDVISIDMAQDTPLYLDFGLQDPTEHRNAKDDFQLTETNLLECLDLHILVFNRKNGNETDSKELSETNKFKKYEAMSDADIIMAIQSKCSKPVDVLNKAMHEVKASQPTHKNQFQEGSKALKLDETSSKSRKINTYLHEAIPRTSFEISTRKSRTDEEELNNKKTEVTNFNNLEFMVVSPSKTETQSDFPVEEPSTTSKNNVDDSAAVKTINPTTSTDEIIFNSSSNDPGFDGIKNNIDENGTSSSKELLTNDSSINDTVISSATDIQIFASTEMNKKYEESLDDLNNLTPNNGVESTNTNLYTLKESALEITTPALASQTVESKATSIELYGNSAQGEQEIEMTEHTTERLTTTTENYRTLSPISEYTSTFPLVKDLFKNFINVSIPSSISRDEHSKDDFSTSKDTVIRTSNYDNSMGDKKQKNSQMNITPVTTRPKYAEKAIKIPKIVSKELVNGSVISIFDSFEKLPNNDFKELNYSDEDSRVEDSNVEVISVKPLLPRNLTGKLYILFDQLQVPAQFVQNSKGEIHIGIDGNSLCDKLRTQNSDLLLISKMCTIFNQSDSSRIN